MMSNLSERDRRTLRMGGIAAVAIVLFMFVGAPLMDHASAMDKQIADAKSKFNGIQERLNDEVQSRERIKTLRDLATLHPDASGLNQQTAHLLHEIEGLPNYKAIQVRRMEGLPLREEELFYRSAVSLQFQGTLGDLHKFLQDIEKAKPGLKVDRMSLTEDSKEVGKVDGQMVISAYAVVLKKGKTG